MIMRIRRAYASLVLGDGGAGGFAFLHENGDDVAQLAIRLNAK